MKVVELSRPIDVSDEEILDALSPRSIIEYADTYTVRSIEETNGGHLLFAEAGGLEATFEFTEIERGYEYTQCDEGPFEEMETTITVEGSGQTTVQSAFTFGGRLSFLFDRFAAHHRRSELDELLHNLAADVERRN